MEARSTLPAKKLPPFFAATVAAGERGYFGGLCVERGRF